MWETPGNVTSQGPTMRESGDLGMSVPGAREDAWSKQGPVISDLRGLLPLTGNVHDGL